MSERALRKRVIRALKPLHAVAVENGVGPGTPDVNFVEGWIELKQVDEWPRRGGPLRLEHYTQQQRIWHRQRSAKGGNIFVLLQVGQELFLFDGPTAARYLGIGTRRVLIDASMMFWPRWPGDDEFRDYILEISE